jgi:hypothetical protein
MTTATSPLPVSNKALPMTLGLAAFAAALVPFLSAVGVALEFRSGGAPDARVAMWVVAVACLVGLPWMWSAISRKEWAWGLAGLFGLVSVVLLAVAQNIYPHMDRLRESLEKFTPFLTVAFAVALGTMLATGWLGIFIRSAWRKRNWLGFGFLVTGYLTMAAVAVVLSAVVLFAE